MSLALKQLNFYKYCRKLSLKLVLRSCSYDVDSSKHEECLHTPVMVKEVHGSLKPQSGETFIDMTFGAGGHSKYLLKSAPNIKLIALDRDPVAHSLATELAKQYPEQILPLLGRFSELPDLLTAHNIKQGTVDGILFDFGCSSMQFDVAKRGFSISKNGPLDMRMDGHRFPDAPTAADVLAYAEEADLAKILKIYGEEKKAKKIARALIEARYLFKSLKTTAQLCELVDAACSNEIRLDKLQRPAHVATKTFQALRIFVNNEMNELNYAMIIAESYLKVGGRLVTLTFHSLEDKIVKRHLAGNVIDNAINPLPLQYTNQALWYDRDDIDSLNRSAWKSLYKHVLTPSAEEVNVNPRSRSAKLRAAVKIENI